MVQPYGEHAGVSSRERNYYCVPSVWVHAPKGTTLDIPEWRWAQVDSLVEHGVLDTPFGHQRVRCHNGHDLIVVTSGACRLLIGEMQEYHLTPGQLFFIPGGNQHRRFVDDHACYLCLEISPDYFADLPYLPETAPLLDHLRHFNVIAEGSRRTAIAPPLAPLLVYDPDAFHSYQNLFEEFLTVYRHPSPLREMQVQSFSYLLTQFALALLVKGQSAMTTDSTTRRVLGVKTWIDRHLFEPLTVPELADRAGLTPTWFCTVFHQHVGMSPKSYIVSQRVQYAANLLSGTDLSIMDVMQHVGFNDLGYFYRAFKKLMGESPSSYRRKRQKNH